MRKHNGENVNCLICNKEFYVNAYRIKTGRNKHCSIKCAGLSKKGKPSWNKGKINHWMLGEKNHRWRGDKVGYYGLHTWVQRQLGKALKCQNCGNIEKVEWANKNHKYERNLEDWIQLCYKCHRKYDSKTGWGIIKYKYSRRGAQI